MPASEVIANRFVIQDLQRDIIGRGGMGTVYRGQDTFTGEVVAIKALNPDLVTGNPDIVTRFHREAEALRQLDHPNIVKMIAAIVADGRHYLVVEYVGGGNLRQLLDREKKLPIQRVLQIALELADALGRTHHLRIIHRDLKPANVLLAYDGTPKLTDFGVARMADSNHLTQTGMWVGTPHYLSPEACNGEKIDARADIWAFGVMLYEMLAGKVPFAGDTLMATLTAIFRHPLPDLSLMRADVPEALQTLMQHMLVKDRDRRIGSMRLVAAELEAVLQRKPSPGQLKSLQTDEPVDLTQLPLPEFEAIVGESLKHYREGDWVGLSDSPLARSTLVEPYFLPGEPVTGDTRAQALQVMLRWVIEKLNPGGQHSWLGSSWRHYNILYYFYVEGRRVSDLAELMAITQQTFYSGWRPQAITAVATVLQEELKTGREVRDRQRFAIIERYRRCEAAERQLLRLLTVFSAGEFVAVDWIYNLLPDIDVPIALHHLADAYLLQWNQQLTAVRLQTQIHTHLVGLLPLPERSRWHHAAGTLYIHEQSFLEAARHFRRAGDYRRAAQVLITHRQDIFDRLQVEELRVLLEQFQLAELVDEPNVWAQLRLVAGKVAEYLEDLEAAIVAYGEALAASELTTKAEAYYLRAKVFQRHNLDESLAHFAYCIELVEHALLKVYIAPDIGLMKLLVHMYIDRAWIHIQERPDWERADTDLTRAEEIMTVIAPEDRLVWSELYNARAELAHRRGHAEKAIAYHQQAWLAASETRDVELMVKTAYNLGLDYIWARQHREGQAYLQKSIDLSQKVGNVQAQALSMKALGSSFFFQKQYEQAIAYYLQAYRMLLAAKNLNWLASTCQDLAEVYAETGVWQKARKFYEEGVAIAQELGHERYLHEFAELVRRYPSLVVAMNERQTTVLRHVQTQGTVTMQSYMDITGVSRSQAHRDLSDLVEKQVLQRVGRGRATRYLLVGGKSDHS
ncbi:MAG: protein kinase [Chloroflexota bacterium]